MEVKKRKKPQNSCRRRAGNGGDMGGKRKKCRKERVGSVAANPDNLGSIHTYIHTLSRLIRGFRNKYH